ncbi:hypothetical protein ACOTE8_12650 [Achromobacter xylosoxidans]|uniref:hypothetical protein n=1 Tax=Alcaligenes xylosoxydans xylosoxydans TaxID=85698 RepID=UPI001061ECA6|nr:hypothetical protein [Achromobacter xylosoxidans]
MDIYQSLIEDLKIRTNGKLIISPEILSDMIGISTKQQSKLRKENNFPIPYKNMGRNVFYSIYHVADFLLNGEVSTVERKEEQEVSTEKYIKPTRKKQTTNTAVQDLSHLFLLRSFLSNIETDIEHLKSLHMQLSLYEKSATLKKELEEKLTVK